MELEFEQWIICLGYAAFISVPRQFCDIKKRHIFYQGIIIRTRVKYI